MAAQGLRQFDFTPGRPELVHDHGYMIKLAEAIIRCIDIEDDGLARVLNGLRVELSRTVRTHCAKEVRIMGQLKAGRLSPDISRRYHDELAAWSQALVACNSQWPADRVRRDRQGFIDQFTKLTGMLQERVRWEQDELYPLLGLPANDRYSG